MAFTRRQLPFGRQVNRQPIGTHSSRHVCESRKNDRIAADPDTHFRPEGVPGVRVKRMSAGVLDSRLQPGLS
jgi:hypothetical protein